MNNFKTKIVNWLKENKLLIVIALVFFVIRLPFLDQLNLLHDERDISLSGYSIATTGRDLVGNLLPLNIKNIAPDNPIISIYYSAFWWLVNPVKSVFNARLPYVVVSTLLIPLVYHLILLVHRERKLAILTSIVCCFSPWLFHITRLGMDVTLAFVTLLIAINLQLKKRQILSYLFYILTFYNYQGFRLLIPFIIFYNALFFEVNKNLNKKLFIDFIFLILLFSSILFIDKDITQKRVTQVVFLNSKYFENQIIFNRNTSVSSSLLKSIFDNKITAPVNYILSSFIKGQDMTYLFKEGDYSAINGNISAGQFFLPLLFFYYLGLFAVGKKLNKCSLFILGFIPLGMIPSLMSLNGISFGIRGIFSSIGFSYIIANGLLFSNDQYSKIKNILLRYIVLFIFLISLFISLLYFTYTYFCRRPILVGELFNENERLISQYIVKQQDHSAQFIYSNNVGDLYRGYEFFNNTSKPIFVPQFFNCNELKNKKTYQKIKVISSDCMTDKEYNIQMGSASKKIFFSDISNKIAYFIFE